MDQQNRKKGGFSIAGTDTPIPEVCKTNPKTEAVYIAEGWATAKSISTALDTPVVVAFDTSNIKMVAEIWRQKQPEAEIYICGDDDRFNERGNVGKKAAQAAAEAVGGYVVLPYFPPASAGVDFNDLQASCGIEAVRRQIQMVVDRSKKHESQVAKRSVMAL